MPDRPPQLLLTVNEAAAALSVSRRTIYNLMRQGDLEVVHLTAGSSRITWASVQALAARSKGVEQ